MGDPAALSIGDFSRRNMKILERDLPKYSEIIRGEILPNEQAQLDAAKVISPQYYDLLTSLYQQYAPQLAAAGADIDIATNEKLSNANADLANRLFQNQGTQLALGAANLDRSLDPEYYKTREAAAGKLGELLNSINLDAPNIEAERLVNQETARSGNITPNATSSVSNALSFGNELQKRRDALGQAISAATQYMPQSRTGFSGIATGVAGQAQNQNMATGQGLSQFGGVKTPGSEAYQMGSQMYGTNSAYQTAKMQADDNNQAGVMKVHQGILGALDAF